MSEEKNDKGLHGAAGSGVIRTQPPTPKSISAQSQARNSYARIVILGGVLLFLGIALMACIAVRPEHVKDLLIVIGTIAGYLAGSQDFPRRDDK